MNTITILLSSIENQLLEYNSRLNSIETSLCNVYDVAALPPVTQNPSTLDTSPFFPINCEVQLPTRANVSLPTEDDFNPRNEIHTPPNYRRTTSSGSTTSISPLVCRLPSETTRSLKKIHTLRRRTEVSISVLEWISSSHKKKWLNQTLMGSEINQN